MSLLLLAVVSLLGSRAGLSLTTGLLLIWAFLGAGRDTNNYLPLLILPLWWLSTAVGLLRSPDLIQGLDAWLLGIPLLSYILAITRMHTLAEETRRLIFRAFMLSLVLGWFVAMMVGSYKWLIGWLNWDEAFTYATFTENILQHPTYLALMINIALIWLIQQTNLKRIYLWLLGFFLLFLLMTAARLQIFIGLGIIGGILFFKYPRRRKWLYLGSGGLILMAICAVIFLPEQANRLSDLWNYREIENIRHSGVAVRLTLWEIAWREIMAQPLTGVGLGNVQATMEAAFVREGVPLQGLGPHNQYLHTALAIGLPGMCALIFALLVPLINGMIQRRYTTVGVLLLVMLGCLTEDILSRQIGICTLAIFLPLTWPLRENDQAVERE
ncbi:MAG: O-antigen ligase family protein [Bacteroidota bacterium]